MEEERWWGMKENTISAMPVEATEPNPARLTLGTSAVVQPCLTTQPVVLPSLLGDFLLFWSSVIQCHPSVVRKTAPSRGVFWVKLLTWTWGPEARSYP